MPENKAPESKPTPQEQTPAGQAFVVQLGALKNADKVNEIVAKEEKRDGDAKERISTH